MTLLSRVFQNIFLLLNFLNFNIFTPSNSILKSYTYSRLLIYQITKLSLSFFFFLELVEESFHLENIPRYFSFHITVCIKIIIIFDITLSSSTIFLLVCNIFLYFNLHFEWGSCQDVEFPLLILKGL